MRIMILTLLALTACSEDGEALSGEDLTRLFQVEQVAEFSVRGTSGMVTFRTDRAARLTAPRLGTDSGRWWIEGKHICMEWQRVLQGQTRCAGLTHLSDGTFAATDRSSGLRLGTFKMSPGLIE